MLPKILVLNGPVEYSWASAKQQFAFQLTSVELKPLNALENGTPQIVTINVNGNGIPFKCIRKMRSSFHTLSREILLYSVNIMYIVDS